MVLIFLALLANPQSQEQWRVWMDEAYTNEEKLEELHSMLSNKPSISAWEQAYLGTLEMLLADKASWPWSKYKHFKTGASHLDDAAKRAPADVEIRYLRFACQTKAPSFLSYAEHLDSDKKLILAHWPDLQDQDLKARIRTVMLDSSHVTPEEKAKIR